MSTSWNSPNSSPCMGNVQACPSPPRPTRTGGAPVLMSALSAPPDWMIPSATASLAFLQGSSLSPSTMETNATTSPAAPAPAACQLPEVQNQSSQPVMDRRPDNSNLPAAADAPSQLEQATAAALLNTSSATVTSTVDTKVVSAQVFALGYVTPLSANQMLGKRRLQGL
jgi:Flp pilus assembly protein TadG